jgi:hypothetical protein
MKEVERNRKEMIEGGKKIVFVHNRNNDRRRRKLVFVGIVWLICAQCFTPDCHGGVPRFGLYC